MMGSKTKFCPLPPGEGGVWGSAPEFFRAAPKELEAEAFFKMLQVGFDGSSKRRKEKVKNLGFMRVTEIAMFTPGVNIDVHPRGEHR